MKEEYMFPRSAGTMSQNGISLRDFTAIVAMHALISRGMWQNSHDILAKMAYKSADAMLEQSIKEK